MVTEPTPLAECTFKFTGTFFLTAAFSNPASIIVPGAATSSIYALISIPSRHPSVSLTGTSLNALEPDVPTDVLTVQAVVPSEFASDVAS